MRESVAKAFVPFSDPLEGTVPFFYQDVKGLVTIAIGVLVDPLFMAINLPLVRPDGTPADESEIAREWWSVKRAPPDAKGRTAAQLGHRYVKQFTKLRLTPDGVEQVVRQKLGTMVGELRRRFPDFDEWCADAQLATLSMSWACGPAFRFPKLESALKAWDFTTAAKECRMNEKGNPGLAPRNDRNLVLYQNAARVDREDLDPDVLYWPRDLAAHGC